MRVEASGLVFRFLNGNFTVCVLGMHPDLSSVFRSCPITAENGERYHYCCTSRAVPITQ